MPRSQECILCNNQEYKIEMSNKYRQSSDVRSTSDSLIQLSSKSTTLLQLAKTSLNASRTGNDFPERKGGDFQKYPNEESRERRGNGGREPEALECEPTKKLSNKEKLMQTLQKNSQFKKKCEELLRLTAQKKPSTQLSSQPQVEGEEKIQLLSYNEISEAEYAHKPMEQEECESWSPPKVKSESPSFVSIFSGYCLEQFQIVKFFNEGISGKVYLAQSLRTRNLYSVKMINRSSLTPSNFNQLVREIKIQSFLAHPNVVKLYHSFIDKEFVYLFLEPCLDGDLFATCKRKGRLSEKEAREVVKQVCSAVEYMHKHDIIHRDLKPENILLHEGVAKICDFGWAVYSPLLRDTRCGTPVYASPEMIKKELYDSKIDIWNIGVLTYELLFGNIPFEIKQVDDINKIVDDEIYFSEGTDASDAAKSFILGCLSKNPLKRYGIRQAIEHDFLRGSTSEKFRLTMA